MLCVLLSMGWQCAGQEFIGCHTCDGWAETPMLRKTFTITANDLKHHDFQTITFSVEVVSLGYHEVYVNGTKVGNCELQPAVSQLDKRALATHYDITPYIHEGDNELMLWLGQGWGRIYGTPAAVRAAVMKEVSDEECSLADYVVWTDSTWEASPSPYSYTGSWQPMQFGGERYDAQAKPTWRQAATYDATGIGIRNNEFGGNSIVDTLEIQEIEREADGSLLLDFVRVVTGWFDAVFETMAQGQEVTMEYLDHRDAKPPFTETDTYVSDGEGRDLFRNRFHAHAFRHVRIKGANIVYARALQLSAVDPAGGATFECSDPRLNAIHDIVKYTLSCLTFSGYMVDCPHIERMGYGGDGNSSTNTLQTLWDVRPTYRNWVQAWADAMDSTGDLPYVAPAFRTGGGPYWQSFIVKAPWSSYLNYGDMSLMWDYYHLMKRWLDHVEAHSVDGILQPWPDSERHAWFLGDWAVPNGVEKGGESVLHVSSCVVSECLAAMEQMARLTGHHDDALLFAQRRQKVDTAIHRHFYHPESHTYACGTPLDQCYALLLGIPPDSATASAVKAQLLDDCHGRYRNHIAAGLVGVPVFTEWCIRERQADLMATILRQPDYPGYLYMIDHGATTTWESWDCGRPGREDRSRVHNCYNGIGTWFYQALAGIRPDPDQPGYRHFFVDPQRVAGVDWLRASKPTSYGTISVDIDGEKLRVSVPPKTTATLFPKTAKERTVGSGVWEVEL